MNDKERILMTIIRELKSTMLCARDPRTGLGDFKNGFGKDGEYVHFEGTSLGPPPEVGSLVVCDSGYLHDYTIGFVEEVLGYAECMIREIGTDRLCRVSNESFSKIVGLREEQL